MTHEGFISFGNLRAPYVNKFELLNWDVLKQQQEYFEKVIFLIRLLMDKSCEYPGDNTFNYIPNFKPDFDLSTYNVGQKTH